MINVSNIERFAINDGPGIRTIVFLQGCPLRCRWCANPETRQLCSSEMKIMSEKEVMEIVLRDRDYYVNSGGGLTLSGGEPTVQIDAVESLLGMAVEAGLSVAVETCGEAPEMAIRRLLPLVNYWLFDLKHTDSAKLKEFTSSNLDTVMRNLKIIVDNNPGSVVLRLPCIPGFNMEDKRFEETFRLAVDMGIQRLDMLPYHTLAMSKYEKMGIEYPYPGYSPLKKSDLEKYCQRGLEYGLDIKL